MSGSFGYELVPPVGCVDAAQHIGLHYTWLKEVDFVLMSRVESKLGWGRLSLVCTSR